MADMIKCPSCGADNTAGSWFCKNCGALFDDMATSSAPAPAAREQAPVAPMSANTPEPAAAVSAQGYIPEAMAGLGASALVTDTATNRFVQMAQETPVAAAAAAPPSQAGFIGNDYMENNYQDFSSVAATSSGAALSKPKGSSTKILIIVGIIVLAIVLIAVISAQVQQAQYNAYNQNNNNNNNVAPMTPTADNNDNNATTEPTTDGGNSAASEGANANEADNQSTANTEPAQTEDTIPPYAGDKFVVSSSSPKMGIFIRSDHVVNGQSKYLNDGNKIGWIAGNDTSVVLIATGKEYDEGGDGYWWYQVEIPQWYRDTQKQSENYAGYPLIGWVRQDVVRQVS